MVRPQKGTVIITRQVQHLTRLVDDLLDVARLTSGRLELRPRVVDFGQLVDHGVAALAARVPHRLDVATTSTRVHGDPARLEQIVTNLLDNAAKYTPPDGTIRVEVTQGPDRAVLRVRDSGVGIAPDLLPRIFDLFTQADRSLDRSRGGLGIGLTLARRLVELHGGTLTASSAGPGRGSEFVIRLPVNAGGEVGVSRTAGSATILVSGATRRVLVIDDSVDAAESTAALVRLWGHQVKVLHSGENAARVVDSFHPHVVLLDIGLPDADGFEVAELLAAADDPPSIVLISSRDAETYRERVRTSPARGFLAKHELDGESLRSLVGLTT